MPDREGRRGRRRQASGAPLSGSSLSLSVVSPSGASDATCAVWRVALEKRKKQKGRLTASEKPARRLSRSQAGGRGGGKGWMDGGKPRPRYGTAGWERLDGAEPPRSSAIAAVPSRYSPARSPCWALVHWPAPFESGAAPGAPQAGPPIFPLPPPP
ncbi:hypothetical protein CDD83_8886 [Cordyceps sp. RAO-2017]|nr:hypothetical protein CDD83_8886 [Cordyceps sp. RAO-2017]